LTQFAAPLFHRNRSKSLSENGLAQLINHDCALFLAQVADRAEREKDALMFLKRAIAEDPTLTSDALLTLRYAFRSLMRQHRGQLDTVSANLADPDICSRPSSVEVLLELKSQLVAELTASGLEMIDLVEQQLLPASLDDPSTI
jgi:hypothetical protein